MTEQSIAVLAQRVETLTTALLYQLAASVELRETIDKLEADNVKATAGICADPWLNELKARETGYFTAICDVGCALGLIMPERVTHFAKEGVSAVARLHAKIATLDAVVEQWRATAASVDNLCDTLRSNFADANKKIAILVSQIRRLEAEKAGMVTRNKLLRDRPDLPIERLAIYRQLQIKAEERDRENERLKNELAAYKPICLNCGKDKPCMTEKEANRHGASVPCTFDPTPHELFQQNKRMRDELIVAQETIARIEGEQANTLLIVENEALKKKMEGV